MEHFKHPDNNNPEHFENNHENSENKEDLEARNVALKEQFQRKQQELMTEDEDAFEDLVEKQQELAARIQEKYPDYDQRALYHVLIGGSLVDCPRQEDFPGDESVEKFIKETLSKHSDE